MIILDFGSGNTCKNDKNYVEKMIGELAEVVPSKKRKNIIVKWQLFQKAGENTPLSYGVFDHAYNCALEHNFLTTASAFDYTSLAVIKGYNTPFIKIANNMDRDIVLSIPRGMPLIMSFNNSQDYYDNCDKYLTNTDRILCCRSEYPAHWRDYECHFERKLLQRGISDHTDGLELWEKYHPLVWEKHYKLEDSTGLDAGSFSITPKELSEII